MVGVRTKVRVIFYLTARNDSKNEKKKCAVMTRRSHQAVRVKKTPGKQRMTFSSYKMS